MVFLKEVLFAPDTTRLSLEVRVLRVWLVRLQIRKQFWPRQAWAKVAAGNQRAVWRTRVGGAERPPGVGFGLGAETEEGRSLWVGVGACPDQEGACSRAGTAICGGGTKRPELDPRGHRCKSRLLAGVGVAAQAGRRRDAAGE